MPDTTDADRALAEKAAREYDRERWLAGKPAGVTYAYRDGYLAGLQAGREEVTGPNAWLAAQMCWLSRNLSPETVVAWTYEDGRMVLHYGTGQFGSIQWTCPNMQIDDPDLFSACLAWVQEHYRELVNPLAAGREETLTDADRARHESEVRDGTL